MTYDEVYDLKYHSAWVRNRTIIAVGFLANYYAGLGANATAGQQAFVQRVLPGTNAEIEADYILWGVIFNTDVQNQGMSITDDAFKGVVETLLGVLNRFRDVSQPLP